MLNGFRLPKLGEETPNWGGQHSFIQVSELSTFPAPRGVLQRPRYDLTHTPLISFNPPTQTSHQGSLPNPNINHPNPSWQHPQVLPVPSSAWSCPGSCLGSTWGSGSPGWLPWGPRSGWNASPLLPLPALPSHVTCGTRRAWLSTQGSHPTHLPGKGLLVAPKRDGSCPEVFCRCSWPGH